MIGCASTGLSADKAGSATLISDPGGINISKSIPRDKMKTEKVRKKSNENISVR